MRLLLGALCFLLSIAAADQASAERRVALVIGNSAYEHTGKLTNPKNDANDMAAALRKHGFQVIEGFDLDKAAFDRKVRDFATQLQNAAVGVFFYGGHGLQVAGHNYMVPIDAELKSAAALDFEMVRLDVVHRAMERQASTNILFLDACRDNPLARNLARAMGTRSSEVGRGLAAVESGAGTLISFSTQPGNVALDGTGRNSPFAGALVRHLTTPNDDLSAILINVRNDVMRDTQDQQVPWENSALRGRVYFGAAPTAAVPQPNLTITPQPRVDDAVVAWGVTKDTQSIPALEAFIRRFGDTYYGDLAKTRVDELKQAAASREAAEAARAAKKRGDEDARARAEAERRMPVLVQVCRERADQDAAQRKIVGAARASMIGYCDRMLAMPCLELDRVIAEPALQRRADLIDLAKARHQQLACAS